MWLLSQLGEISGKHGIRVNIPDTAVWRSAKIVFVIYSSLKNGYLKLINQEEKINIHEVYKAFMKIVKARKRDLDKRRSVLAMS